MGAISGLFGTAGGDSGSGYETPSGTNQGQLQTSYGQNQTALQQQQALLAALQGQQGLTNQSNVYNQLQGVVSGTGPNPAATQLAQSTGANVQNQAALQAGQRGAAGNVGLMARQAAQTGAATQQQAAGQAATLQAQQSLNALGAAGNLANTEASQQIAGTNAVTGANQAEQSILQGANTANNNVTGQLANTTMQGQQGLIGGIMQGIGGAMSSMAKGGVVPKKFDDGGDVDPDADKGDTPTSDFQDTQEPATPSFGSDAGAAALAAGAKSVSGGSSGGGGGSSGGGGGMSSMIGMAAMAAAKGGRVPYATGDQVAPPAQPPIPSAVQGPQPMVAATDPNAPKSKFGKFMKQAGSSAPGGSGASALQQGSAAMSQGLITALKGKKSDPNANLPQAQAQAAQMEQGNDLGNNEQYAGADASTGAAQADQSAIDPNDPGSTISDSDVEYAAFGGNMGSKLKKGGHVPGKPKVSGAKNSYKNDTVKALLSPGEVVIPRSVTQGKNPVQDSAKFVAAVLAKRKVRH